MERHPLPNLTRFQQRDKMPLNIRPRIQPGQVPSIGAQVTQPALRVPGTSPSGAVISQAGALVQGAGQAVSNLGENLRRYREVSQERDNKTIAGNAYLSFSNQVRDIESKYYARKGINSQGSFDSYTQDVEKAFNDTSDSIGTDRARQLFEGISRSRRISSSASMRSYERTELEKAHLSTSQALVEDSIQDAVENFNNPMAIQSSIDKIIIGVGQQSDQLGWSADTEKVALENAISKMHVGVVEAMLINDAVAAKDYAETNIKDIQGFDRTGLEGKIRRHGLLQESQDLAGEIHIEAFIRNLSLPDELALIPRDNADLRKATESLIRQKIKDDEFADLQARDDAKTQVYNAIFDNNVDITGKMNAANSLDHVGDRGNAIAVVNTLQTQALALKKREIEKQSPLETFNAKQAIDSGMIQNQTQLVEGYFNKVNPTDFKFLTNYLNQGGQIGDLKPSVYNSAFRNIFGRPDKNKAAYLGAVKFIRDQVQAGNSPTPDNVNQWIITSATAGEEIEGRFFSDMTFAKAVSAGVDHIWLPDIEDHEEDSIKESIENYNLSNPADQIEINEFNKRLWKRIQILQLAPPDPSIEKLF